MTDVLQRILADPAKAKAEFNLIDFARQAWHCLEPVQPCIDGWAMRAIAEHLQAVTDGQIKRLLINVPPGFSKSLLTNVFWPAWEWGPRGLTHHRFISASYKETLATRDMVRCRRLVRDPWYQQRWPVEFAADQDQKTYYENTRTGFRFATGVRGDLTGFRGDRIIIDDPHSVKTAESEADREEALFWFTETLPTRFNTDDSALVVIMQRLHERDISGLIISELGDDYVHLCLPMRFEEKHRSYTIVKSPHGPAERVRRVKDDGEPLPYYVPDPDGELLYPQDPRDEEGELCWPERFSEEGVDQKERAMTARGGNYAVACNPGEAPVLMSDLTLRRIDEVVVGDEVVGFERAALKPGCAHARHAYVRSKVLSVGSRVSPVVRITFEDGTSIRCTANHRWFKRSGRDYSPAQVGGYLRRVCPQELPELDPRDAGWLAGFFDGDGTVSSSEKRGQPGFRPSGCITLTQGDGRNLAICEKLERVLESTGFPYSIFRRDRGTHDVRYYRLTGHGLPMVQKFLHCVRPTKWRDRLLDGVYGCCNMPKVRVTAIEPDGVETVYSLQTETGNYVVWGYASSNSQHQQRPVPRGGGMFKRADWQFCDRCPDGFTVRGWDLAATKDGHAAWTVGLKMTLCPDGGIYISDVVRIRGTAGEVRDLIRSTADGDGYDVRISIPQDPGQAGKAQVTQFARDLHGYDVTFSPESGQKEDRARPLAAQVEGHNVWLLRAAWNDAFLGEASMFPGSEFKDQIDAASRAYHELVKEPDDEVPTFGSRLIS